MFVLACAIPTVRPYLFCCVGLLLCSARFRLAQVPSVRNVKVNWVRPGKVVHESQQVTHLPKGAPLKDLLH
jgi:hypothetical protein